MKKLIYILAVCAAALSACGDGEGKFQLKGTVAGAAGERLTVQRSVNGVWIVADTVSTDGSGEFSYEGPAPDYPQVFRLERKGRYIYFPVDSVDRLEITADTAAFDTRYTLSGTPNAEWMLEVDRTAISLSGKSVNDPAYKKAKTDLTNRILRDPSSVVAYYTVEKIVDGRRLFAPENPTDLKVIGAVATGFSTYRPGNPIAKLLEAEFLGGRRLQPHAVARDTIEAEEIGYIDITLKDAKGKDRKLSELTAAKKVILLNFTTYAHEQSPDYIRQLAAVYAKYEPRGFEIYQIGYDNSEFEWKEAAVNLPWVAVYDPAGLSSQNLLKYNVQSLPCMFIIGRDGTISERVENVGDLDKSVARNL